MSGYVAMSRNWQDHDLFDGDEFSRRDAWAWLISQAAWKPTSARVKGAKVELNRGDLCFSQRFLAEKWGWSKSRVDRFIALLRDEGMIETRSKIGATADHPAGQGQSIISICNYDKYQSQAKGERGNDEPDSGATAGQQRGKEEEREEGNKDKNAEADASVSTRQPLAEALSFWNDNAAAVGWPRAKGLSGDRPNKLRNRLRENGIDGFRAAVTRARASPYLAGPDPPAWFTLDWMLKPANFQKLSEGNYDRRRSDGSDPTTDALRLLGQT